MDTLLESIDRLDALVEAKFSVKRRKKVKPKDKLKNKKYYRRNKAKLKKKSRKWNRSAKGRRWKRLSSTFAKRTKNKGSKVRRSVRL